MHHGSITSLILQKIENGSRDSVYVTTDFLDLGEYDAIRQALFRLEKAGEIQKIMRCVFYYPGYSELIQECQLPSPIKGRGN